MPLIVLLSWMLSRSRHQLAEVAARGLLLFVARAISAQSPADAVLAAERAFSRSAQSQPVRQAFLAVMADSGILLGTGDKAAVARGPEWPIRLEWGPIAIGVARAGDLAWSTGPARRRSTQSDAPVAYTNFATIWQRGTNNVWRVLIDTGVDGPAPDSALLAAVLAERQEVAVVASSPPLADTIGAVRALEDMEIAARRALAGTGAVPPLDRYVRFLRSDQAPIVGRDAMRDALDRWRTPLTVTVQYRGMSRSRDLAWRAGRYVLGSGDAAERGNHLRVWRIDDNGQWRIALEVWSATR
jgi:ketosteroid isomerase-like protein